MGASSASEIAQRNIQLLDPLTLNKKTSIIGNQYIAAPSINAKAAAIALAAVAKSIEEKELDGTLVIAWTTLELINGKGIEAILNTQGPFAEIHRFNRFLDAENIDQESLLANGLMVENNKNLLITKPASSFRNPSSTIDFSSQPVYEIGLPSRYTNTPVELIAISDVENLMDYWMQVMGSKKELALLPKVKSTTAKPSYSSFNAEYQMVSELISQYGVSYDEERVRKHILSKLPAWAKPEVDSEGNIILNFGQGEDHIAFVAHMDETGYVVDAINEDGTLIVKNRGGMLPWIWEAQPALIHVSENPIQAVFEPRADFETATKRTIPSELTVFAGFNSKSEALATGIQIGKTTVTMPKEMIRMSENRAAARGFDDRVGCAALLMSLTNLNPAELKQRVTFVWSTAEETGLVGASFAAKNLQDLKTVYPIDTYVSSDDPFTDETFANCPLGNGAVIRVLESINFISRENLKAVQNLAAQNKVKVQYGMTAGGTDGQPFLGYGIPSIPLSWPGRYSHSPVEIMDYRDLSNLVMLINSILLNPSNE